MTSEDAPEAEDAASRTAPGFDLQAWLQSRPPRNLTPGVDDQTYPTADDLLAKVIDHYLTSREFNGLPVGESTGPTTNVEQLIRDGLVQLVTSTDYLNTHIRPWLKDDWERQVDELADVACGEMQGCMYPTPAAMRTHAPQLTHTALYRDRMIMGHGTLELVFFDLAALENYVNDPVFNFTFGDDGFRLATAPRACLTNVTGGSCEAGAMSRFQVLSDGQWSMIEEMLPRPTGRKGRPFADARTMIEAIVYRYRTGIAWRDLPEVYGPWQTVWTWHRRMSEDGTWDRVLAKLTAAADEAGLVDWTVSVDSTIARAHQHATNVTRHTGGWVELHESGRRAA